MPPLIQLANGLQVVPEGACIGSLVFSVVMLRGGAWWQDLGSPGLLPTQISRVFIYFPVSCSGFLSHHMISVSFSHVVLPEMPATRM